MTEKSTTTQAWANSSAPKSRTAQNETMREKVTFIDRRGQRVRCGVVRHVSHVCVPKTSSALIS